MLQSKLDNIEPCAIPVFCLKNCFLYCNGEGNPRGGGRREGKGREGEGRKEKGGKSGGRGGVRNAKGNNHILVTIYKEGIQRGSKKLDRVNQRERRELKRCDRGKEREKGKWNIIRRKGKAGRGRVIRETLKRRGERGEGKERRRERKGKEKRGMRKQEERRGKKNKKTEEEKRKEEEREGKIL